MCACRDRKPVQSAGLCAPTGIAIPIAPLHLQAARATRAHRTPRRAGRAKRGPKHIAHRVMWRSRQRPVGLAGTTSTRSDEGNEKHRVSIPQWYRTATGARSARDAPRVTDRRAGEVPAGTRCAERPPPSPRQAGARRWRRLSGGAFSEAPLLVDVYGHLDFRTCRAIILHGRGKHPLLYPRSDASISLFTATPPEEAHALNHPVFA